MFDYLLIILDHALSSMWLPAIVSAIVLIGIAVWNSKAVRNRETAILIHKIVWDAEYIEIRDTFIKVRDGRTGIKGFIGKPNTKAFKAINKMMSHYEVLAIGIKRGILSEKVLKDFMGKRLVADWHASKAFIMAVREKNNDETNYIFCEFEILAKKWEKEQ